jgi:hypothetical protein
MNPQEAFLNLLLAAMADAVTGDRISQLKTSIDPDGKGVRYCRIIVIPEDIRINFPKDQPIGSTKRTEGQ